MFLAFHKKITCSVAMCTNEVMMEVHRAIGDLNRDKLAELLQDDREPIDLTKVTIQNLYNN